MSHLKIPTSRVSNVSYQNSNFEGLGCLNSKISTSKILDVSSRNFDLEDLGCLNLKSSPQQLQVFYLKV
jgi:hypothetical protein